MRQLRAECPWKREQTHRSLARYLLEETHETLEAIDTGDATGDWDHLREELGDLLLQVYFHAVVAEESGAFTIDDVARGITEKMHRRNPHVFGPPSDDPADGPQDAAAVNEVWQAIKERDKPRASLTDGLPDTLPALLYAAKVVERGAHGARSSRADARRPAAGPGRARPSARGSTPSRRCATPYADSALTARPDHLPGSAAAPTRLLRRTGFPVFPDPGAPYPWHPSKLSAPARSSTRAATPPSRSRCSSTTGPSPARPCPAARPPARSRRSSCATAATATSARASRRPSTR